MQLAAFLQSVVYTSLSCALVPCSTHTHTHREREKEKERVNRKNKMPKFSVEPHWSRMTSAGRTLVQAVRTYWRTLFTLLYPICLLPVFIVHNVAAMRCLYVVLLMAGYWMFEALPLAVTSLLPMVLFPLMGVLDSDKTSVCYLKETNMMFIGGLIIAIAVEHCNLHTRVALYVIRLVGCSPRRLNVGLCSVTMFVSMWISNTAAAAMMIPIIEATLKELESQGLGSMYESEEGPPPKPPTAPAEDGADIPLNTVTVVVTPTTTTNSASSSPPPPLSSSTDHNTAAATEQKTTTNGSGGGDNNVSATPTTHKVVGAERRPTRSTMCYFISTAYAASIGGLGCIVGSGTNLTFKGIYEVQFPASPGVEFAKWMMLNVPIMLLIMYLSVVWLQFWFMGLFRPESRDAKRIRIGGAGEAAARKLICQRIAELGPMTFHEGAVGLCFCLAVLLWFFRQPQFITGWAELITDHKVKDATAAFIVVMLLFIIPARPDFVRIFSADERKRPKRPSPALITWKVVQQKLPWGLIFLLGGGFTIAQASNESGMSKLIAAYLDNFAQLPRFSVMAISCVFATVLTQFSSNVAVANVLLPVLAAMAVTAKVHPMYLMLPTAICCSNSFCLPVSSPPNAIAAAPCNMNSAEMAKAGLGVVVISLAVIFSVFPLLGTVIWDFDTFPEWVK